jgi:hypothetical protein
MNGFPNPAAAAVFAQHFQQVSISPIFYVQLFGTKVKRADFLYLNIGLILFWHNWKSEEELLLKCW